LASSVLIARMTKSAPTEKLTPAYANPEPRELPTIAKFSPG